MAIEIKTIKTDDYTMNYFSFGSGRKSFVIIPGVSLKSVMDSAMFVAAAYKEFAKDYTCYVFDRKQHIREGYSVWDMAEDTADAMRQLGIREAYVFGASQGGMIAECIAIRYPELIQKLVLGSTLSKQNALSRETFDLWYDKATGEDVAALNRVTNERIFSEDYRKTYAEAFRALENVGTPEEMQRFSILVDACRKFDCYAQLQNITCQTLVIGSMADHVLGGQASEEIAQKLHCESYMYEGYSHAVYDEAPDYRAHLLAFFDK